MTPHEKNNKIDEINEKLTSSDEKLRLSDNKGLSEDERKSFRSDLLCFSRLHSYEIDSAYKEIFKEIIVKCYLKTIDFHPKTENELKNQEEKFSNIERFSAKENFDLQKDLPGNGIQDYKDVFYHNYASHLLDSKPVTAEIAAKIHEIYTKKISDRAACTNIIVEKLWTNFKKLQEANQQMKERKSISIKLNLLEKNFNDLIEKHEIDIPDSVTENIKSLKKYSYL